MSRSMIKVNIQCFLSGFFHGNCFLRFSSDSSQQMTNWHSCSQCTGNLWEKTHLLFYIDKIAMDTKTKIWNKVLFQSHWFLHHPPIFCFAHPWPDMDRWVLSTHGIGFISFLEKKNILQKLYCHVFERKYLC